MLETTLVEVTAKVSAPCRVFFKNEFEQPSGSFKLRGIGHLIASAVAQAPEGHPVHVYSSSGGNAGLAAAYAAQAHGVPCTVVLPVTSKPAVIAKLQAVGATVVVHGSHWGEADAHVKRLMIQASGDAGETNGEAVASLKPASTPVYCHPFDDPLIWEGHASMVAEMARQTEWSKVKGIVCSVGGGGLFNGIVHGLASTQPVPVLAVETAQAPTFTAAIAANQVVHLESVPTLATSLASPYLSSQSLAHFQNQPVPITVETVDDTEAIRGMVRYEAAFGRFVEPACGASLVTVFGRDDLLRKAFGELTLEDIIVIVVCGGSGVNQEGFDHLKLLISETAP